ncbi:MAG: ribosome small subunit-dependent GTPase A [Anaeroplasmataceae bacterium]
MIVNGRIINLNSGNYKVFDTNGVTHVCRARGIFRSFSLSKDSSFNYNKNQLSNKLSTNKIKLSPKVGDIVDVEISDGINYITKIYERKNQLIRPDISNVDQIVLITSSKGPDFSNLLLDMFITNLEKSNIIPYIIITKIDKLEPNELTDLKEFMKYYETIGYKVTFVNSFNLHNKEEILLNLSSKFNCLSGQTGAGKSTLINNLLPGFNLQTQEISQALGRGKHTTRETNIYSFNDFLLADTPGFSKLDLVGIDYKLLKDYFIEFSKYPCKFKDCIHDETSISCGVKNALKENLIINSRYNNYLKILNDIKSKGKK